MIIDECESILSQFNSSTMRGRSKDCFDLMTAIIKNSKKLICLDGDLGNRTYNFINHFGKSININNNIQINKKHFLFTKDKNKYT